MEELKRLSPHFILEEFLRTSHDDLRQENYDTFKSVYGKLGEERLTDLCRLLEKFREVLGRSIIITSGYRCPSLNYRVGGVENSHHTTCYACDFACSHREYINLASWLRFTGEDFDQFIFYKKRGFAHISISPRNRNQIFTK